MIRILDPFLINQIAAGEVIERPFSIVKELVENSIDAGSTSITVEAKSGGLALIRVTDNGHGMGEQDACMAFERHATSKISTGSDLEQISSLGFRGEALASIAAVSQVEMFTCVENSPMGTHVTIHAGKLISAQGYGCPEGTSIIVRNLFYNTPARLKFLKSVKAEAAGIADLMCKLIVSRPEIAFKYLYDDKLVYLSSGNGKLLSAITCVYGNDIKEKLLEIEKSEPGGLHIYGFLGKPSLVRMNRNSQTFFVNGRYVKNFVLSNCLNESYRTYIPVNQYPWAVLFLKLPFDMIDVNVHPAKTQVRFKDERHIYQIFHRWVKETLKDINVFTTVSNDIPLNPQKDVNHQQQINIFYDNHKPGYENKVAEQPVAQQKSIAYDEANTGSQVGSSVSLRIVGSVFGTYIIAEGEKDIFLIDQHAAHERILYEKFKDDLAIRSVAVQMLLHPVILELKHHGLHVLPETIELLSSTGFEIDWFDQSSIIIRGIPSILSGADVKAFIIGILDEFDRYKHLGNDYKLDRVIKSACKKAVKANDSLSEMEMIYLLEGMIKNRIPSTCPHGRPIIVPISLYELEVKFKRV